MLNYYQPALWPFLYWRRYQLPPDIKQQYFFSFEDGLWELLRWLNVKSGAVILVPDFYCMDVVENIQQHGYRVIFYPLDEHFQTQKEPFHHLVKHYHPAVVVAFHACGITNKLLDDKSLFKIVAPETIVIEDSVQSLVDPEKVLITRQNHFVMDSLRKVSPLPGSMLYGLQSDFSRNAQVWRPFRHATEWQYVLSGTAWYLLFRLALWIGVMTKSNWLVVIAHELILKKHDNIIGDSKHGHQGFAIWAYLHRYINFSKVAAHKAKQVALYQQTCAGMLMNSESNNFFYRIAVSQTDRGKLHVFPIGLQKPLTIAAKQWLHANGAVVWQKFPDAPWSKDKGVLFLPLGFHVSEAEIQSICLLLAQLPKLQQRDG